MTCCLSPPPKQTFLPPPKGLHFNLPCVETHEIVDMRTITLGVPPQEVVKKKEGRERRGKKSETPCSPPPPDPSSFCPCP